MTRSSDIKNYRNSKIRRKEYPFKDKSIGLHDGIHRPEYLETSDDDTWKSCIICGGELTQVRKALFSCLKCNQEYIADEEDMRPEKRIIKNINLNNTKNN